MTLSDWFRRLTGAEQRLQAMSDEVSLRLKQSDGHVRELKVSNDEMSDRLLAIERLVASLNDRLGNLVTGTAATSERTITLGVAVSRVEGALANLDNRFDSVISSTTTTAGRIAALNDLEPRSQETTRRLAVIEGALANLDNRFDSVVSSTTAAAERTIAVAGQAANIENRVANLAVIANPSDTWVRMVQSLAAIEAALAGRIANTDNRIDNVTTNVVDVSSRMARVEGLLANLENRIVNLVMPAAPSRDASLDLLMARGTAAMVARSLAPAGGAAVLPPRPVPTLEAQMAAMREAAPANFDNWLVTYRAGIDEGVRTVEGNLSHEGHVGATYFRMFLNIHARGRILDVGCGPLDVPTYLADWPTTALAGIDPQNPFEAHPFPFARTFAETIPWPDASFETVVVGTSLDHVYLLDQALAEMKRVLVPGGRLLLWTAMFDETPAYDPRGPAFTPPDAFHLFHPGRNWFYRLFERDYRLIERLPTVASAELIALERRAE